MNHTYRRFIYTAALLLCSGLSIRAAELQVPTVVKSAPGQLTTYDALLPLSASSSLSGSSATPIGPVSSNLGTFQILLNPNMTLSGNAPALAAFQRAADKWEARISDPITVNIDANLAALDPGIIGSAGSQLWGYSYNTIRNSMIFDSSDETDDGIVSSLPAAFSATFPSGFSWNGQVAISQANAKALGATFAGPDGEITFSTEFNFDYDNSDGITPGFMDFESVAAHEIGHVLGFTSWVDQINGGTPGPTYVTTLDLFRFVDSVSTSLDPIDAATFATATRNMVPGAVGITDFGDNAWGIGSEFRMSTGTIPSMQPANGRDGRQASHWKDNLGIGIMDPTLGFGEISSITEADFRALDLIGWDIAPIPEPSTYALGVMGLASLYWLRRKRVGVAL